MARSAKTTRGRSATAKKKSAKSKRAKAQVLLLPKEIAFDFIKSNYFRVISVDGAFGGLSLSGRTINMAIYSERRPIPKRVVTSVKPDGFLGDEVKDKRDERDAIVRELEANLVFDLSTAIAIRGWLDDKITQMVHAKNALDTKGEAEK